ncbi:MAG: hypothetical protein IPP82_10990 [Xanthomonadales bacterium]|nr:hypothetical protein [Xanthomonadales bacterium]
MILRRLTEHLKQQHWTAIGIELVIVVLGVFLGMQVSNWNEDRETNQKAAVFTERLKTDLRGEDWSYQFLVTYNREVLANAERAVGALEGKAPLSDEALLVSAYRATQYRNRNRRGSTYDELVSTGAIGLIRDQILRDTAMRLYNLSVFDNLTREGMQSRYREAFRMSLPNEVQRALGKHCGDRVIRPGDYASMKGNLDYPCHTDLSAADIAASASALRANPDMVRFLRLRIADLETRLFDLTRNNQEIMDNLRAFAKETP